MKGTPKQQEAYKVLLDSVTKELLYGGAAGGGKSFIGCFWLITMCLAYPGTRWFIAREELKRIRQSTLITFFKVAKLLKVENFKVNYNDNYIEFSNGSRIDLLDIRYLPSDPLYERFGSTEYTGGWIEEGGETKFGAYEVLKTRIGRHMNDVYNLIGKLFITCNPTKNFLYLYFYKPWKKGELEPTKKFIQALVDDNPHLTQDYINTLKGTKDKNRKERLLKGNWEYDDDPNALCSYDDIEAIFENDHIQPIGSKFLTADIARLGSDKAIIAVWHGWVVIEFLVFDKSKTTAIQEAILALRVKHQIPTKNCIADEDGVGGGVVDNCRIKGFVNNSSPLEIFVDGKKTKPNYMNLQTQCCYGLADVISESSIYIKADVSEEQREHIVEELEQLKSYKNDSEGKIRILPKAQIKDNIGRSPDWRDVLMMRKWFDLSPYKGRYMLGGT